MGVYGLAFFVEKPPSTFMCNGRTCTTLGAALVCTIQRILNGIGVVLENVAEGKLTLTFYYRLAHPIKAMRYVA